MASLWLTCDPCTVGTRWFQCWELSPGRGVGSPAVIRLLALWERPHPEVLRAQEGPPSPAQKEGEIGAALLRQNIYTVLKATNMLIHKPKLSETGI